MLRYGLITFLNAQPDLVVCGEADSILSALIKIAECKPHLQSPYLYCCSHGAVRRFSGTRHRRVTTKSIHSDPAAAGFVVLSA